MRAVIVSLSGPELCADEAAMLRSHRTAGVILFARNCVSPDQVAVLCRAIREAAGEPALPVLIDQEGGRVMRLRPPLWRDLPPMRAIGRLAEQDEAAGLEAARLAGRLIGGDLSRAGITVNCAPLLDVAQPGMTNAIGDRAFSADPALVGRLGLALIAGLQAAGVAPVIKHLPGHGRARVDSHLELPRVETGLDALRAVDFVPFLACRQAPIAMTAHLLFTALDQERPATQSPRIVREVIRAELGFEGILLSDDLSMSALAGPLPERAALAIEAGCDLALYCHGVLEESLAILERAPAMPFAREALWRQAVPAPAGTLPEPAMLAALAEELSAKLERAAA